MYGMSINSTPFDPMFSDPSLWMTGGRDPVVAQAQQMRLQPIRTGPIESLATRNPIQNIGNPQPQMPNMTPPGLLGPGGGFGDSGPSFDGAPDGYDASNPGAYSAGLGEVIGSLANTGIIGTGGMIGQGVLNAAFPNTVPAPTGPFDALGQIGNLFGGGSRGNAQPASFTVPPGTDRGPTVGPVPPQGPVVTSLLGDPGEGQGTAPGMGASDANFDGISFGDLGDFGYSGGFGVF
jgi:hypothetical protein